MDGIPIRRILLPLDGSELAETVVPHAEALATAFRATVILLRAVNTSPDQRVDSLGWRLALAEASGYLRDVSRRFAQVDVDTEVAVEVGRASEVILQAAHDRRADVVMLCTHGRGGLSQFPLSGTVQKVLSRAPLSVKVVRATEGLTSDRIRYRHVIVPVDCSPRSDWAVCTAATIARACASELVLVHAVRKPDVIGDPSLPGHEEQVGLASRLTAHNRTRARRHMEELTARLASPDLRLRSLVVEGHHIASTLGRVADAEPDSMVVLAAHGFSPRPDWPCGRVPAGLVAHSRAPVLMLQDLRSAADRIDELEAAPQRRSRSWQV